MDLIYTDKNWIEKGVLQDFVLDLAYGSDENDFSLEQDIENSKLQEDCQVYVEGTEYGGLIDNVSPNTSDNKITYTGRTWHGVLDSKIIVNKYVEGEANAVLKKLIADIGADGVFTVLDEDSGININGYTFIAQSAYAGISDMLHQFGGKLKFVWNNGKVLISAEPYIDYSSVEEFDSSQTSFEITKYYHPTNHVVVYGSDDEGKQYMIHVFSNENGEIQQYAIKDVPLKDADYILDTSKQLIFGTNEIAEVIEVNSVGVVENYEHLTVIPADWNWNYESYYGLQIDDEGETSYKELEGIKFYSLTVSKPSDWDNNYSSYFTRELEEDEAGSVYKYSEVPEQTVYTYNLQNSEPSDWATDYEDYYTREIDEDASSETETVYKYFGVSAETLYRYTLQTSEPSDWATNWDRYYYRYTDGTGYVEYRGADSKSSASYKQQTTKPSDWATNYKNYYTIRLHKYQKNYTNPKKKSRKKQRDSEISSLKKKYKNYKQVKIVSKNKAKGKKYGYFAVYYTLSKGSTTYETVEANSKGNAPAWKAKKYYTKHETEYAPSWKQKTYYTRYVESVSAPKWKTKTYYTKLEHGTAPTWTGDLYYKESIVPPPFENIYAKVLDHYAGMVEDAIDKIEEAFSKDSIRINLDDDAGDIYDIGDVVGATEHVTGINLWQPITKKIIKITSNRRYTVNSVVDIEYTIGGTT